MLDTYPPLLPESVLSGAPALFARVLRRVDAATAPAAVAAAAPTVKALPCDPNRQHQETNIRSPGVLVSPCLLPQHHTMASSAPASGDAATLRSFTHFTSVFYHMFHAPAIGNPQASLCRGLGGICSRRASISRICKDPAHTETQMIGTKAPRNLAWRRSPALPQRANLKRSRLLDASLLC